MPDIYMTPDEIAVFTEVVGRSEYYLEYGAGGSSKYVAEFCSASVMISVESDPEFVANHVANDVHVQRAVESGRLRFNIINIGECGLWGHPVDNSKWHLWPNYSLSPYINKFVPDTVFIDGRFRVACALAAAFEAPDATVLIHDYTYRKHYHILERFFGIETVVDTLVRMKRLPVFDEEKARATMIRYLYEPGDREQTFGRRLRNFWWRMRHGKKQQFDES
jgi:hypothetical protein